ncbi:serine protease inhibitor 42Dd [Scaptodrosophila lebanonensis]|uniref:Serine protease inhibitor 42Dd n=1 Tax=Drosophila lebanonensis TaxID=7225 RepID=A0A6J2U739_DROLE|nr:serine protease inhibitor 42Dd [Scaptodrosophila lebanonensis]
MNTTLAYLGAHAIIALVLAKMAAAGTILPPISASPIVFARKFFRAINEEEPLVNMVVSPAAARSGLTLAFMGAHGKAAEELRAGLLLGVAKKPVIAKRHAEFWSKECTCSDRGVAMRLATRLYVKDDEQLQPNFNQTAAEFFNAQADVLNLTNVDDAANRVNKWLEMQTFHTVRNLLTPAAFNDETSVILVNSLYFRAKWDKRFPSERTKLKDFWINPEQRMEIQMMRQEDQFKYGESKTLRSKIIILPFEESEVNMMIIVPQDKDGLPALEQKLQEMDLNEVAAKTIWKDVEVVLPRFKIECDLDLKVPLQKLGISRIFEPGADLSGIFLKRSETPQKISEARQKLYLDVNESGCETDPDTAPDTGTMTENPNRKQFKADRPFVFAIRNNQTVYFVGHFVKP